MPAASPESSLEKKVARKNDEAEQRRKEQWRHPHPAFLDQMDDLDRKQSEEVEEWKGSAILGLAEHELAAQCYTRFSFFLSALPNMLIPAVASVLVMLQAVPHKDIVVAVLSGLSAIIAGTSAFFNWQGESEKHRSAVKEYNVLMQRIEMLAADRMAWPDNLAHRAELFKLARREVQGKVLQIKKEVQPAPPWIRSRAARGVSRAPLEEEMRGDLRRRRLEAEREKVEQLRALELPRTPACTPRARTPSCTPRVAGGRRPAPPCLLADLSGGGRGRRLKGCTPERPSAAAKEEDLEAGGLGGRPRGAARRVLTMSEEEDLEAAAV